MKSILLCGLLGGALVGIPFYAIALNARKNLAAPGVSWLKDHGMNLVMVSVKDGASFTDATNVLALAFAKGKR